MKRVRKPLLIALVVAIVTVSSMTTVDATAEDDYRNLFQRALITFALARTLNGIISAVQGTELALQPAGVGLTLTPGEVLDPVNDLIERFSWIMLGATLSLGVQQVMLEIGQWWGTRVVVAVFAVAWLLLRLWRRGAITEKVLLRALIVALFIRFAVPVTLIANEAIYDQFLQARYVESRQVIESAGAEFDEASVEPEAAVPPETPGVLGSLQRAIDNTREAAGLQERLRLIKARATEVIEHLIQLSVVFILQTGIFPLLFLWLMFQVVKRCFGAIRSQSNI